MNPSVWLTAWPLDSKRLHKRRGCFLLEQQLIKKPAIENMFHDTLASLQPHLLCPNPAVPLLCCRVVSASAELAGSSW